MTRLMQSILVGCAVSVAISMAVMANAMVTMASPIGF